MIKKIIKKKISLDNKKPEKKIVRSKKVNKFYKIESKKIFNVDNRTYYDIIIIISSYDRYNNLLNLISSIINEKNKYSYKIIILDDGNIDNRYSNLIVEFKEIVYLKNKTNNGKKYYWKTINMLFNEVKKYKFNVLIQLDDDFILCKNFLTKIYDIFLNKNNKKLFAISFHHSNINEINLNRWGLNEWIDGGGLYSYKFLKLINFKVDKIGLERWKKNEKISSGVWKQISKKINKFGGSIYKTNKSYVDHQDNFLSKMNKHRVNPIKTWGYNYE